MASLYSILLSFPSCLLFNCATFFFELFQFNISTTIYRFSPWAHHFVFLEIQPPIFAAESTHPPNFSSFHLPPLLTWVCLLIQFYHHLTLLLFASVGRTLSLHTTNYLRILFSLSSNLFSILRALFRLPHAFLINHLVL